jgi:CRP/FNR family transcriptional regulator, cyclic AMP receptor protein
MTRPPPALFAGSFEKVSLFQCLPPEATKRIQTHCNWRRYEPGELILDYLDKSDDVFFITDGEARVSIYSLQGKAVTFSDLAAGEIFGEIAAIDGAPRSASIEARTHCCVASMPRHAFLQMLESEPLVALELLRHMVVKVRALTTRVYEFSSLDVANRTRAELLRLARMAPRQGKSASIAPIPTHAEIASRISTHREAVTREINRLSKIGVVQRQGGMLVVKDVDRLEDMVHEASGE